MLLRISGGMSAPTLSESEKLSRRLAVLPVWWIVRKPNHMLVAFPVWCLHKYYASRIVRVCTQRVRQGWWLR